MSALRRKPLIGATLLMVGFLLALSLAFRSPATRAPEASTAALDWPAMTPVYRDEGKTQGLHAGTTTKVWKLTYRDVRHWRKELRQDTSPPGNAATTASFQGTTYTLSSAMTKETFTREYPASDGPIVPEQWLMPGRAQILPARGYAQATAPDPIPSTG